ncbi:MAG: paraquat-inducible protein A [Pseudomonadota bacterium]
MTAGCDTLDEDLDGLIACPQCDAIYRLGTVEKGDKFTCTRCHTPLASRRHNAGIKIIALAIASTVLAVAALFLPFLEIRRLGFANAASIIDTALAFSGGPMFLLSLGVVGLIVGLPLARLALTLYTLMPLVADKRPWPGARRAFRLSEDLKPWSMAEIFVIGCAISLIKLTDLARVEIGVAFWMFVVLVIFLAVQDALMDRHSVWTALER